MGFTIKAWMKVTCFIAGITLLKIIITFLLADTGTKATPSFQHEGRFSNSFVQKGPESEKPTFSYTENELLSTIRDIRLRNCNTANKEEPSFCERASECDGIKHIEPGTTGKIAGCERRVPRALVIGVAKCGTREVLTFLSMHHMLTIKLGIGSYFQNRSIGNGLDWYRDKMPYSLPEQITMEKGNYFNKAEVPGNIRALNPDMKLLLMVRDPVARQISQMTFLKSVDFALAELNKEVSDVRKTMSSMSIYDEPFDRYLRYFNRSQILVVDSDKFKSEPFAVLRDIETFLQLPHAIQHDDFVYNDQKGFYCVRSVKESSRGACFGETRGRTHIGNIFEKYKPKLREYYKPHNERFFSTDW